MNNELQKTIEIFLKGGIVIFPTDTAFGIGCRIDDAKAVDRVFRIRKRPVSKPMPILVSSEDEALSYFNSPSDIVRHLMETHWPGALTIISWCQKDRIYSPIRAGADTIGIRMPDHPGLLEVIKAIGVPILGSSANMHGEKTPFHFKDLDKKFIDLVDYVMPGQCHHKNVSTVVDCTVTPYRIVRQGVVHI